MAGITNAARVRAWLLGCGAIDPAKRFGVDYLGDAPTENALITAPSALKWAQNINGERKLKGEQAQDFVLATRASWGADVAGNLENLAFYQAVARWITERNAAGDFPEWEGGVVTGVTPTLTGAPVAGGVGTAQYQMQIRVNYSVE